MRLPAPRERWPDRCGKGPSGSPQPHSHRTPPAGGAAGVRPPPRTRRPRPPPAESPGTPPPTRLSCGGRGDPPGTPPEFGVFGWGAHGDFGPSEPLGTPPRIGGTEGGSVPNGAAPPGAPPSPEQILGARLRLLGDAFQHSYERQRRGRGLLWAPLFRWVAPWIGAAPAAPLAARGGN